MRNALRGEMLAEFFGTFILIMLGDGVVAHVGLAPRLAAPAYDWNTIVLGWGFAVAMAVYVAGGVSGAHINPAVTLGLAVKRGFPWSKVGPYIVAQMLGAFFGAAAVYLVYFDGLQAAGLPNVWATGPGSVFATAFWGGAGEGALRGYSLLNASVAEFFGTLMLLWGVLALTDEENVAPGSNTGPLMIGFLVLAIGLSLGGPSGYAINPARDLAPRIFGAIVGTEGLFDTLYWLIPPVLVTSIAGMVAPFFYDFFISPFLPKEEPVGRTSDDVAPSAAD
ncbi:MAG: MIP family channel protein [Candidatus Promineifilaceae bacterium]|nr:MIP family channel protein [Candidatus Promineifilaceae bacterium]